MIRLFIALGLLVAVSGCANLAGNLDRLEGVTVDAGLNAAEDIKEERAVRRADQREIGNLMVNRCKQELAAEDDFDKAAKVAEKCRKIIKDHTPELLTKKLMDAIKEGRLPEE